MNTTPFPRTVLDRQDGLVHPYRVIPLDSTFLRRGGLMFRTSGSPRRTQRQNRVVSTNIIDHRETNPIHSSYVSKSTLVDLTL